MDSKEFLIFATELRELGALEVCAGEFRVTFPPRAASRGLRSVPKEDVPETFASEEQAKRWRERAQGR